MTRSKNQGPGGASDVDPSLSRHYRQLATESTPDKLDRTVIRAARKEVRRLRYPSWIADHFKPAAFVVMFALSFAVILEMNDAGIIPTSPFTDEQVIPLDRPSSAFQDAAETVTEQLRDAAAIADSTIQNSVANGEKILTESDTGADQSTLPPDEFYCDARQRSTVSTWWQCIEALENRGATVAAERELAELTRAFPGFVQPD